MAAPPCEQALYVKGDWLDLILNHSKTWEVRGEPSAPQKFEMSMSRLCALFGRGAEDAETMQNLLGPVKGQCVVGGSDHQGLQACRHQG